MEFAGRGETARSLASALGRRSVGARGAALAPARRDVRSFCSPTARRSAATAEALFENPARYGF